MKGSITIVSFFIAGVLLGRFIDIPAILTAEAPTLYALYALMFLVGISIGSDKKALQALKQQNLKIILVPLATIIGTLIGSALISFALSDRSITDCLAVGSGFGYYSLSSIFITQYKGAELGTIALVSNIMRELLALLAAPLLIRYFGKLAPISVGGATTADTTLPIITKFCGKEFVIISIVHGITVDLSVPFLVTFFCTI
ncbi:MULTISPECIES: lysine exporter LysO family protein [Butyricimonas]|uniref:Lysine exporter LysO family protein n=1 Tax=Butyricimonas hominis TaxID=2763032 RepID=A0ABR7D2Z2_9BACT|nr:MULTISPECIES: lysine exporter LysO family protein [Butyricimonas]MBC5622326.1 lysine exporter LysO family protein [Butyricimonas hominis]MCB6974488.1 lysine exporter LysO family protein [Butyricimonas synergistica]MCG4521307.1 lysine exporter LysO family protein [Butyricimonas sp. DFI.6.44]